jgi:hypothetical protein
MARRFRVLSQEGGRTDVQASPASGSLAGRPVALNFFGRGAGVAVRARQAANLCRTWPIADYCRSCTRPKFGQNVVGPPVALGRSRFPEVDED